VALAVADAAPAARNDRRRRVVANQRGANAARILHDLLQLTGAIGFTWEYGLHFYERRVQQDARLAANPRAAVRTLTEIEGWSR
jgi:hypothetical protein